MLCMKFLFSQTELLSQYYTAIKGKAKGNINRHWQVATELTQETGGQFFKAFQSESAPDPRSVSDATAAISY